MKAHHANKEIAWRKTVFARLCCAILTFNNVPNWQTQLRQRLGLPPLNECVLARINEIERQRLKLLRIRRHPAFQKRERDRRYEARNRDARQDKSGYTGRPRNEE